MLSVGTLFLLLAAAPMAALASPSASDAIRNFHEWFDANGGVAPKLRLQEFPGMGLGVAAVDAVAEDDVVISVPLTLVVCVMCKAFQAVH